MVSVSHVISQIRQRIVALVEGRTTCPQLRRVATVLAEEFAARKLREGLGARPDEVDVESSARHVLRRQTLCLYAYRTQFTPTERIYVEQLADLVGRL